MAISSTPLRHFASTLAATLMLASGALAAAPSAATEAQARYREDIKVCNSGQSNQDRATCRLEARMSGQGSDEGSVAAGGVLHQSVTVTPAK
jgi:hypothetical protein